MFEMGFDDEERPGLPEFPEIPERLRRRLFWLVVAVAVVIIVLSVSGPLLTVWLNVLEFGELFIKPIYFEITSGLILATIALVRLDIRNRRSLTWWAFANALRVLRASRTETPMSMSNAFTNFDGYRLPMTKFVAWQLTKILVGASIFGNVLFGMAVFATAGGWNPGLDAIWGLLPLPFVTPPFDMSYAQANVIPAIPALTLLLSPLLGAIGVRLLLLVGLTQLVRLVTPTLSELGDGIQQVGWRIPIVEALAALGIFWYMVNGFFPPFIDFNTKVVLGGLGVASILLAGLALWDHTRNRHRPIEFFTDLRRLALRYAPVVLVGLLTLSVVAIQSSIADPRKIEYLGPYTTQSIAVNRYLAELDEVTEVPYEFSLFSVPQGQVTEYVSNQSELLNMIRLWDWTAANAKLRPEIGLIPYLDFEDSDIIRFNGSLYWSASLKPVLPPTVTLEDAWFNEHLVYTHATKSFLLLHANEGTLADPLQYFPQQQIYYGEGGLLETTWGVYPSARTTSDEIDGVFYDGEGGLDLPPPLSWLYELNFLTAYSSESVHLLRYRDIFDRMSLLFPYFEYSFGFPEKRIDMFPVTDGTNSYYLMPLIVRLDTFHVPWSAGNPLRRFVGYALVNVCDGDIQLLILGDDYFSELFKTTYSEFVTTSIPDWLVNQTRYPEELFEWRMSMYDSYHVTDPATFINANEFYEVPTGLDTYYIFAQPPTLSEPEFVGILSLEIRGAEGKNLAGYAILQNDFPDLGRITFFEVDIGSETKLLGPTAVKQALERNSEYRQLRTLLQTPREGDTILYRIGETDVYFIPVYTSPGGGVVTEMGVIAAIGAAFTGEYYIGLGQTADEAYANFLYELAGVEPDEPDEPDGEPTTLSELIDEANAHLENFMNLWAQGLFEEAGGELSRFMELWSEVLQRSGEEA